MAQSSRLRAIARSTCDILAHGKYHDSNGAFHDVSVEISAALNGTVVYPQEELERLCTSPALGGESRLRIDVTPETTQQAAFRLSREISSDIAVLNFASAKKVCGGFLTGARAQEEDLARSSALYECLKSPIVIRDYYEHNRRLSKSLLYTDTLVYTPKCPFFRVSGDTCVPPYFPSVISGPAPNALAISRESWVTPSLFEHAYKCRARYVLALARGRQHRVLVLGAWGCGVFKVEPAMAATVWKDLLREEFSTSFDQVVFAIYDGAASRPRHRYEQFKEILT